MAAALTACVKVDESTKQNSNAPVVQALPFHVEEVMRTDRMQGGLKLATVNVGVRGGTPAQWAATSVAIAEKAAAMDVNSVEVYVRRDEIVQSKGARFREVAHVYYSPDPKRSVWSDGEQWKILRAESENLSTQKDVNIYEDYYAFNDKFSAQGLDADAADQKAGVAVAKKYHLPKDWQLPVGNSLKPVVRDSMNVDAGPAGSSLDALYRCMNGRIIRAMTACSK